jgi:hypothetical protein
MNEFVVHWLQRWGMNITAHSWIYWVVAVISIALVVYLVDVLYRRLFVPLVRKITRRTQ